ncbi:hypothetical protein [Actinomadura parmotrematis]|uniref:Lipoprotein n=1 Tax=Actinomadura parmotrematis TaxID=2864039 RepID=A0ABS7FL26_9ACTN|nr:hypothetical protein [Actinomadura parmotrematis]MBW8481067.1 hypothetical protein [Actinomadura parmotrematis]
MLDLRAALFGTAVLALAAGCGGAAGMTHAAAEPATIEQLAARTGCSLSGTRSAEELRQGACQTARGRYTLVGFSSGEGRRQWLEEARPWGGSYLVGPNWVAVGTQPVLQALKKDLGGDILDGEMHH